ncbi:MAG: DmsC/YnfH family molybdoenzyme membrane anchor subunit [Pseudomonadota bacterium]
MHPARSIILFTTLSGLGFGLLACLGLGLPPVTGWTAFAFFAIAYALASGGLIASTFHLGHPERALKAFTQWRSSWLSREGWLACITLALGAVYAFPIVFYGTRFALLGWLVAVCAVATVLATSMIYAQLKTVPRWHHWSTPLLFFLYAAAGGLLLAGQISVAPILLAAAGAVQIVAWVIGDGRFAGSGSTLGTATGLGDRGTVRAFEPPHTGPNYLTKEMVHVVARKHAARLRVIGIVLASGLPALALVALPFSHGLAVLAILAHIAGILCIRWLFFAEAEHVVSLYYGRRAV